MAPTRATLDSQRFEHPVFDSLAAFRDLLLAPAWPDIEQLQARLDPLRHRITGLPLLLVPQDALDPGGNYEQRIFETGHIATRRGNWHDLFNALAWTCFPAIKSALNAGQVADMAVLGTRERSRRQAAFTQFDEAGAIAFIDDPDLLACWDRHDWHGLFIDQFKAWTDGRIRLAVFGHALFEHALNPDMLLVSRTIVVLGDADEEAIARAMLLPTGLNDPQQLRPLPLAGIPGWDCREQDAAFIRDLPCFRPLRPGRRYPPPLLSNLQCAEGAPASGASGGTAGSATRPPRIG